jgi:flagellar basal body-associated protein FliL
MKKKSKKLLFVLTLLFILLILALGSKFYFSFRTKNNQKDEQITIGKKLEIKYYSDEETGQKFYIEEEEFRSKRSILYPESVDKEGGINKFSTSCEETVDEC